MRVIPYGRQDISEADIQSVVDVLRSDYLTQGQTVPAFEECIMDYCGVQHAVAVNSATSALHIACLALGIGKNDMVWTSPITFVASANCALYCGAKVDFVDVDPRTYNMSVERLSDKLESAKMDGTLPKAVIPVHFCGQSCDMEAIHSLGQRYGFKIIEDASHAIGGEYKGEAIGNCRYSDIAIFSFHPVKIVTTGEGGMALTNNLHLAKQMRLYRSHGISSDAVDMHPRDHQQIWNYQQIALGFNYRMTDILAALGLSQMKRLDTFVAKRRQLALRYDRMLKDSSVVIPWQSPDGNSSYHLYPIRLRTDRIKKSQREVYESLRMGGILVNLHYIPVYLQPYYRAMGFMEGYCPEAEKYYSEAISIPLHPGLSKDDQDYVINTLQKVIA